MKLSRFVLPICYVAAGSDDSSKKEEPPTSGNENAESVETDPRFLCFFYCDPNHCQPHQCSNQPATTKATTPSASTTTTDPKGDLMVMRFDFLKRMSAAFPDSKFLSWASKPLDKLTQRLSALFDRHSCKNESSSRKRRSTWRPELTVCHELENDLDRILSWADKIDNCGNSKKRNRRLTGTIKKLNKLKGSVKTKCPKKVNRKAKGKKV